MRTRKLTRCVSLLSWFVLILCRGAVAATDAQADTLTQILKEVRELRCTVELRVADTESSATPS